MSSRKRYDIDILNNYDVLNWQKYGNSVVLIRDIRISERTKRSEKEYVWNHLFKILV